MNPHVVSLRSVVRRVAARIFAGPVLDSAAQLAFYAVLALAPFLVVLTSLAAFAPSPDTVGRLLARGEAFMPPQAYRLVARVVADAVAGRSGALFTTSLVMALWSASRAANALRKAINGAHGLEDGRSWVRQQLIAVLLTVGGAALLVASVVATLVGARAVTAAGHALGFEVAAQARAWAFIRWPVAVLSLTALGALAYRVLPDTRPRARTVWWGAAVATALFLASSLLFSAFAVRFAHVGVTFGALGGAVLLLVWVWLCSIAFVVGGEVTAAFPDARPRRSTAPPKARPLRREGPPVASIRVEARP